MSQLQARIQALPYDFGQARRLAEELGISHVLAQVLVRRQLAEPSLARAFLAAEEEHPYSEFAGISQISTEILGHLERGSHVTIHGDYDVDGVCATAVLVRTLRALSAEYSGGSEGAGETIQQTSLSSASDSVDDGAQRIDWFIPSRVEDGYGFSDDSVERLSARGTQLVITVDCGITAVEQVAAAKAAGMDVVITDHHAPRADGKLPDAGIVHPGVCEYPCEDLCGTAVAYKLAQALYASAGKDPKAADRDLDLVALATVADVVPLLGENRRLVRAGLERLKTTARPGLRALMEVARVSPNEISATSIGFRLGPRINAAGRLYRADAGLELLLTQDATRAREIALELDAVNAERRDIETRVRFEAEAQLSQYPEDSPAFVLAGEGWHPGVIGIVAARIAEKKFRPTVLIALDGEQGTGSGRSIPGFDLLAGLDASADSLMKYGGHRAAAGLTIASDRIDEFREAFCAHAAGTLTPDDLVRTERVDVIVPGSALTLDTAEELEQLEPCGSGNSPVSVLVPAAELLETRPLGTGGRHLAFTLESGGTRSRGVAFGVGSKLPAEVGESTDTVARLEVNRFNGAMEPRLVLRQIRPSDPRPVEIIGEPADFREGLRREFERLLGDEASRAAGQKRSINDQRGIGIAGLITDLVSTGDPVAVVCAHTAHRAAAFKGRVGGFALTSWQALADTPSLIDSFSHVVIMDPPADSYLHDLAAAGPPDYWTHLAWGPSELQLSVRIHTWEYALRDQLKSLYRDLRTTGAVSGDECEALLQGKGNQPRSGALAGRLVRILHDLALIQLDLTTLDLKVRQAPQRTSLERSASFQAYQQTLQDGLQFLNSDIAEAA